MSQSTPKDRKEPLIIAVAGGSGSGKTTFVKLLAAALGSEDSLILSLDHYYRDLSRLNFSERTKVNFDHPESLEWDLLVEQLTMLSRGFSVERPCYQFESHTRLEQRELTAARPFILLDGLFALLDRRVHSLSALRLFVETPEDLRLLRRIKRDREERGRTLESTMEQYNKYVKPMYESFVEPTKVHAHLLVPWEDYNEGAIQFLAAGLKLASNRSSTNDALNPSPPSPPGSLDRADFLACEPRLNR